MTSARRLLIALVVLSTTSLAASQAASAATIPPRKELKQAINHTRAMHGVTGVRGSSSLRRVALSHSADMLRRDYFAHTSPAGSTLTSRIQHSGFINGYSWTPAAPDAHRGGRVDALALTDDLLGWQAFRAALTASERPSSVTPRPAPRGMRRISGLTAPCG